MTRAYAGLLGLLLLVCSTAGRAAECPPMAAGPSDPQLGAQLRSVSELLVRTEYERALVLTREVLVRAGALGDRRSVGHAHLRLADVFWVRGDLAAYRREVEQSIGAFDCAGDDSGAAVALYYLAYVHERSRPAEMLKVLAQAQQRAERARDESTLMKIRNALGSATWELGRYDEAADNFKASADVARRLGQHNNLGVALLNQALVEVERGRLEHGLEILVEAERLLEQAGNRLSLARVWNVEARAHETLGDVELAVQLYTRSLAASRELGDLRGQATQLMMLAEIGESLGETARGDAQLEEALAISIRMDDRRRTLGLLATLARRSGERGELERAQAHVEAALRLAEKYGSEVYRALTEQASGELAERRGQLEAARVAYSGACERLERSDEVVEAGAVCASEGRVLLALGRSAEARGAFERGLRLLRQARARHELPALEAQLGRLLAAEGDPAGARQHFEQALADVDALDRLITLDRYRWRLFDSVSVAYSAYAGFLADQGEFDAAWAVAERGRAHDLRVRMAQAGAGPALTSTERDALAAIAELQRQLAAAGSRAARDALGPRLEEAEASYDAARRLAAASQPVEARKTAQAAPSNSMAGVVVEYVRDDDRLLVFSRRAGKAGLRRIPEAAALMARVRRFRDQVADAARPFEVQAEAVDLFELLLGPETEDFASGRITIVPDEALAWLPFAALQPEPGVWAAERYAVSQAPSLGVLADLAGRPAAERWRGLLAVASSQTRAAHDTSWAPLPATLAEARELAQRARATTLIDPTEAQLKALPLDSYDLLHFAGHAQTHETRPERSALVLVPAPGEDGLLQAREIYRLRLPARLVVVSSCSSGRGSLVAGEGVVGLTHALLAAGARALITTSWDVPDASAAQAMSLFYEGLAEASPVEALARMQRRLIQGGRSHPAHWAGYLLSGDGDQHLPFPRRGLSREVWLAVGAAVLIVGVGGVVLRRNRRRRARLSAA